jgi:predicted RNA-binding protein YlqC (UPF0109 family)
MKEENLATTIVRRLAREICLHPDDLEVWETKVGVGIEIGIRAHQGDKPRLIGPKGSHFKSLAAIAGAIGNKNRQVISMPGISESTVGEPDRYPPFNVQENWPRDRYRDLAEDAASAVFRGPVRVTIEDHEEGATTINITIWREESPRLVDTALACFQQLMNSGGRVQGRIITVRMFPTENQFDLKEPRSADGRFAPADRR